MQAGRCGGSRGGLTLSFGAWAELAQALGVDGSL